MYFRIRRCSRLAAWLVISGVAVGAHPLSQTRADDPATLLARARAVMGMERTGSRVLHSRGAAASEQNYQSDRTYPPFFSAILQHEVWFDPTSGVMRLESQTQFPGGPLTAVTVTLDDGRNAAAIRGDRSVPLSRRLATGRNLSAWAVVADWSAAQDVRAAGTELYRDYMRVVLERHTDEGGQKLYLDAKSGFPVKLDLMEPHYLWGQRHIEYVWSTWTMHDGVVVPGAAFRLADGAVETSQTWGVPELVARDAALSLSPVAVPAQVPADLPLFLQPIPPKAIQIGASTWLLTNPGYTEAVTIANDEIYVLDATQSEERARQDAEAIALLFPGRHRVNLVVTDLAWPHVAGLRYWVARGARIVAHAAARDFLQQVVDRRWTLTPDSLEVGRQKDGKFGKLRFTPIEKLTDMGGGRVRLVPIDGIGSELAVMAYIPADRFLWASDYIQTLDEPSLYATEVIDAVARANIEPSRVAAQHVPLSDWQTVVAAQHSPAGVVR